MSSGRATAVAPPGPDRVRPSAALALVALLVILSGFLFFYRFAERDLWSSHEARAAMDARSVFDGGNVLVPRLFDGRHELQKPPLYYWLVAASAAIRGGPVDAADVRLPAALAATACVIVLAAPGWYVGRTRAGLLSAVVLATAAHFTWLARIGRIDMPLTLATSVSVIAAFLALERSRRALLPIAYLAAATGVLLKGPIGFVLPAVALSAYLLMEGEWRCFRNIGDCWRLIDRLGIWWGVPLVLLLTLPWFFAADEETGGELFRVFFWYHNVERALGGGTLRSNPWWFYGPQFIGDFLPWSPFFLVAVVYAWRLGWLGNDPLARLGLAWFCGIFALLTCAQFKRGDYLLPAYPGAALFLGCAATHVANEWRRGWLSERVLIPVLAGGMLLFWMFRLQYGLPAEEPFRDYRPLAALIRREAPPPAEILFFRTEAHALAFRVGRPLAVLVEWSDLEGRLTAQGPHYVVTPPACANECRARFPALSWKEVTGTLALAGGKHERPLVLLRATHPSGYASTKP